MTHITLKFSKAVGKTITMLDPTTVSQGLQEMFKAKSVENPDPFTFIFNTPYNAQTVADHMKTKVLPGCKITTRPEMLAHGVSMVLEITDVPVVLDPPQS